MDEIANSETEHAQTEAPIDLDLVELRCKLRGWHFDRMGSTATAYAPEGPINLAASGEWSCVGEAIDSCSMLLAPRWTLDRLLSEPPEGWRVMGRIGPNRGNVFGWGDRVGWLEPPDDSAELMVEVRKGAGRCVMYAHPHGYHDGGYSFARLAKRHKAAAELALILAEVAP